MIVIDEESINVSNVARINVSFELFGQLLQLPEGAQIVRLHISNDYPNAITLIVRHPDLAEVPWGVQVPEIVGLAQREKGCLRIEWEFK